jgi:hypothetical protein
MSVSTPNFLTGSSWAVNTVIAEDGLFYGVLKPDQLEQRLDWLVERSFAEPGLNGEVAPNPDFAPAPRK